MVNRVAWLLAAALVLAAGWGNHQMTARQNHHAGLVKKLALAHTNQGLVAIDCKALVAQKPLVILALGQSNAGNHGQLPATPQAPIAMANDGKCMLATSPLPGGTGSGGSVWQALPQHLQALGLKRPVVLSVLGIDATTIADWTAPTSPLRQALTQRVRAMVAAGLSPHAVLWQQGEADARQQTTTPAYAAALNTLALVLQQAGTDALVLLAQSTVCRSPPNPAIRAAVVSQTVANKRFWPGPDTDALTGPALRHDGCHFSIEGQNQAAQMWAEVLQRMFASI